MNTKISVVINTLNEEQVIERAIKSIKWADEIIICDMSSEDKTVEIARKLGAKVFTHKRLEYVEPARNFAISKASGEWILILDPDEEVTAELKEKLISVATTLEGIDYVRVPRKNIIFGHWMKASMWWPDLNIRFFKKGKIKWTDKIHRPPVTFGKGLDLDHDEKLAIVHYHYQSVSQFLERMLRYTKIQADEIEKEGYKFNWIDLIRKPVSEFLGRFFANKGFTDGLHGLVLSLLQAFYFFIVYIRLWEKENFKEENIKFEEIKEVSKQTGKEIDYWLKYGNLSSNPLRKFLQKAKNKL